jgi:hypothetical protein
MQPYPPVASAIVAGIEIRRWSISGRLSTPSAINIRVAGKLVMK